MMFVVFGIPNGNTLGQPLVVHTEQEVLAVTVKAAMENLGYAGCDIYEAITVGKFMDAFDA